MYKTPHSYLGGNPYQRVRGGGSKARSDASVLNFKDFDRIMHGSNPTLKPTSYEGTRRNHRDKVQVMATGASPYDQLKASKYKYEFRNQRGVLLGGVRITPRNVVSVKTGRPVGHLPMTEWGVFDVRGAVMFFESTTPVDLQHACVKAWLTNLRRRARKSRKAV